MRQWYDIADSSEALRINIYGDIGDAFDEDSVSASGLLDMLSENKASEVELHVNSGGGSVFDAFAIMTALRNHPGTVTAYVDGLAASAASYLIAAADRVVMSSVAWLMVHDASGLVVGNAEDMRRTASDLERIDASIAAIYAKRSGPGVDWRSLMDDETWLDAEQALELGLADEVEEAVAIAARINWADAHLLDKAPEAAVQALTHVDEPVCNASWNMSDSSEPEDDGADPQEQAEPQAQERVVVLDGIARTIRTTDKEA